MSPSAFKALLLASVAAVVVAIVVVRADQAPDISRAPGDAALAPYVGHEADVSKIAIDAPDYKMTLVRKGQNWVAGDRGDFPAKPAAVATLLSSLAAMRLEERKTAKPELYSEIGVEDPGANAKSTRYTFEYASGAPAGGVIVGKRSVAGSLDQQGATFARRSGDKQAWLANGAPTAPRDISGWFPDLPTVPATEVKQVKIFEGDKLVFSADRDGDGHYARDDGGEPAANDTAVKRVGQALVGNDFEDVRPAAEMGPPSRHAQVGVGDGVIDMFVGDIAGKTFVRFDGNATGAAGELIARMKGFAYRPPGYRLTGLTQSLAELTAAEPAPIEPPADMSMPQGFPGAQPGSPANIPPEVLEQLRRQATSPPPR